MPATLNIGGNYPGGFTVLPYPPTVTNGISGAVDARLNAALATMEQVSQTAKGTLIGAPTLAFDGIAANGSNYLDTGILAPLANIGTGAGQGTASTNAHTWMAILQVRADNTLGYPWGFFGTGAASQGAEYIRLQNGQVIAFATTYTGDGATSGAAEAALAKPATLGLLEMYFVIATDNGKLVLYHPRTGLFGESAVQTGKVFGFKTPQTLRCAAVPTNANFEKGLFAAAWNGRALTFAECKSEYDGTKAFLNAYTGLPALA